MTKTSFLRGRLFISDLDLGNVMGIELAPILAVIRLLLKLLSYGMFLLSEGGSFIGDFFLGTQSDAPPRPTTIHNDQKKRYFTLSVGYGFRLCRLQKHVYPRSLLKRNLRT